MKHKNKYNHNKLKEIYIYEKNTKKWKKNLPHKRMLSNVNKKSSKLQPTKSEKREFKF